MPTYTLVVWNLQDFGGGTDSDARYGTNGMYRADFIARYLKSLDADMLGVMEVKPQATVAALNQLLLSLNRTEVGAARDWVYDSIKSALENGVALTSSAATTWVNGGPRREGYAFYWRTTQGFTMVPAARTISEGVQTLRGVTMPANNYLDLVTSGRPYEHVDKGWKITAGFTTANVLPIKDNTAVAWGDLNFLSVSGGGSGTPVYEQTRRPCFVVVKTKAGSDQATLVPIVIYHCPSNKSRAAQSVEISSYSRQHYVTYPLLADGKPDTTQFTVVDNVVSAGDYNYSAADVWPGQYFTYMDPYKKTPDGGVNTNALLVPDPVFPWNTRTTLQLNDFVHGRFDGDPVNSDDPSDYLRMSIDNLFYRGLTEGAGSGTENLIDTVMDENTPLKDQIKPFKRILDAALADDQYDDIDTGGPFYITKRKIRGVTVDDYNYAFPIVIDWPDFYAGVKRGYFTTARSAAEFVRYFVSDHLPLILKFPVT